MTGQLGTSSGRSLRDPADRDPERSPCDPADHAMSLRLCRHAPSVSVGGGGGSGLSCPPSGASLKAFHFSEMPGMRPTVSLLHHFGVRKGT